MYLFIVSTLIVKLLIFSFKEKCLKKKNKLKYHKNQPLNKNRPYLMNGTLETQGPQNLVAVLKNIHQQTLNENPKIQRNSSSSKKHKN